jgi:LmbE family N-acetylglucosaminyl deacetylase
MIVNALGTGRKVLAIVAHPDDEVIGCGGTLAKLNQQGNKVSILLPIKRNDPRGIKHWDLLTDCFMKSCECLGATPIIPDQLVNEYDAEKDVHRLHDNVMPFIESADAVFTHWNQDAHQVHRGLARAVEIATRPFRRRKDVFLFETATSTEQTFSPSFSPNSYSVLDNEHVKKKIQAMALYSVELANGRTPSSLRRKAQVRGAEIGASYAEAFCLGRLFF